ncbi:hypothetical protein [Ekhidna sp.]|uniref:hypothetical protein n=1 Tax=Ekhidna sp. TaxID=2608089 RepID=UPI003BAAE2F1
MKTDFEKLEIDINVSRKIIWATLADLDNYFNWNTLIPYGSGKLNEGNSLVISLKLKGKTKSGTCKVNKVVHNHYFILSRKLIFKWLLYMEHAFIIENSDHSNVFAQTLKMSGLLKPFMVKRFKPIWLKFHEMNKDLKKYLTKKQ